METETKVIIGAGVVVALVGYYWLVMRPKALAATQSPGSGLPGSAPIPGIPGVTPGTPGLPPGTTTPSGTLSTGPGPGTATGNPCYPWTSACVPTNFGEMVGDPRLKNYPIPPPLAGELPSSSSYAARVEKLRVYYLAQLALPFSQRDAFTTQANILTAPSLSTTTPQGGTYPGFKL
jgi:hypothetical protein